MRDARGQHPRLAGACPRQNENRPIQPLDGLALFGVETFEVRGFRRKRFRFGDLRGDVQTTRRHGTDIARRRAGKGTRLALFTAKARSLQSPRRMIFDTISDYDCGDLLIILHAGKNASGAFGRYILSLGLFRKAGGKMKLKYFTIALAAGALAAVLGSPQIADARGGGGGHGGGFGGGRGGFGGGHVGGMGGMGMRGMGMHGPGAMSFSHSGMGHRSFGAVHGSRFHGQSFHAGVSHLGLGTSTEAFRRATRQPASTG